MFRRRMTQRARPWRRRGLAACLALTALALGLAACGGDGSQGASDGVATLSEGEGAAGSSEDDGGEGADEELTEDERRALMVDHARCMREHGVDMPDPQFQGDGGAVVAIQDDVDPATLEAADEACAPSVT
ncbi:MAG: hypothetical protein GEV08_03865, partial [Acidimicrobiia bacterium]|nr:hypothetical protein [Acidimicrobiia bacterium]